MKILLVEDDLTISELLEKKLIKNNYSIDTSFDGEDALNKIQINNYDCIILDLNLPKVDGIAISKTLKKNKNTTPVLMLTARSHINDKLEGFNSGADDYLTKPFNFEELILRIEALIRRNSLNKQKELNFGEMVLYPELNKIISKDKQEIELSNKESGILEYLMRNKGRVVSSEELLEHVWDSNIDLFTETLKTHIKTLRKKIDIDKKIIKTVRGKGYLIE